jgi:hypothetical protein
MRLLLEKDERQIINSSTLRLTRSIKKLHFPCFARWLEVFAFRIIISFVLLFVVLVLSVPRTYLLTTSSLPVHCRVAFL